MIVKRTELVDQFTARADNGDEFLIYVYQHYNDAGTLQNPNAEMPGLKELMTSDGRHVNVKGKDIYEILDVDGPIPVRRILKLKKPL